MDDARIHTVEYTSDEEQEPSRFWTVTFQILATGALRTGVASDNIGEPVDQAIEACADQCGVVIAL